MKDRKVVPLTPELRGRWQRARDETAAELPELLDLGRQMREAAAEDTLSGHLRRAIHRSPRELPDISGCFRDRAHPVERVSQRRANVALRCPRPPCRTGRLRRHHLAPPRNIRSALKPESVFVAIPCPHNRPSFPSRRQQGSAPFPPRSPCLRGGPAVRSRAMFYQRGR